MYRHNMLLQQATATGYGQTSFDASARPCRRWSHPRGKTTGLQLSVLRGQLLILHLQLPNGSHQPPRFPRARIPVALLLLLTSQGRHRGLLRLTLLTHRLTRHEQKAVWRKYSVVAWGVHCNGRVGTVNSPFGRILFLSGVTAEVAALGYASVELLMSLTGSWISAMLCRRRTLCLLETVYEALRGRELTDVLRLSGKLRMELLSLVIVAPLLQANLRATPGDRLWLVDASSQKLAVVSSAIPHPNIW